MNNDSNAQISVIANAGNVKLQTEVLAVTKNYLRIEAVRRHLTMGQLIDEWVQLLLSESVPKSTS